MNTVNPGPTASGSTDATRLGVGKLLDAAPAGRSRQAQAVRDVSDCDSSPEELRERRSEWSLFLSSPESRISFYFFMLQCNINVIFCHMLKASKRLVYCPLSSGLTQRGPDVHDRTQLEYSSKVERSGGRRLSQAPGGR